MTGLDLNRLKIWTHGRKKPGAQLPTLALVRYLLEAGPAFAEAQSGAGVGLDHHLPSLLSLGCVVEPASHGMAPVRGGQQKEKNILVSDEQRKHHPILIPPPQMSAGPSVISPLIIQVNQVPDVIAEMDSGHHAVRIGLTAVTNMDAEPTCGAGLSDLTPCSVSQSTGTGSSTVGVLASQNGIHPWP